MTRATCTADHCPPRAVAIRRSFSTAATALRDSWPSYHWHQIGSTLLSLARRTAALAFTPTADIDAMTPLRSPPSFVPLAFAAASPAFVLAEIINASCSATAARMWTVSLLAVGKSTATNSTLLSIRFDMKLTLRARRSILAMMSVALYRRQRARASASFGRSLRLAGPLYRPRRYRPSSLQCLRGASSVLAAPCFRRRSHGRRTQWGSPAILRASGSGRRLHMPLAGHEGS